MIKIITLNINGIRSGAKKGFFTWAAKQDADVICLQETKAQLKDHTDSHVLLPGYTVYFSDAQKKGYSGVAIYTRIKPKKVMTEFGNTTIDKEGRYVQLDFDKLSVASVYLPSGTTGETRQKVKYHVMDVFEEHLRKLRRKKREFILCGDWNIAHQNIDLKNWRGNQKNSGFLPQERAWLDHVFNDIGFVDAFRVVNQKADQYTWWSTRGQAWAKNVGWRIDYQIVTPGLKHKVHGASIYTHQRFSDHAPLVMDYKTLL